MFAPPGSVVHGSYVTVNCHLYHIELSLV